MHPGILTDTLNHFLDAFTASWGYLQPSINWLIGILLSIEILLLGLWWALSGGEQLVNVMKKLLFLGFWMWLVTGFPYISHAFVSSLIEAGKIAGNSTGDGPSLFNPSKILWYGIDITKPLGAQLKKSGFNLVNAFVIALAYLLIIIAYMIIAWQVFFAVLEYYLLMAVVSILLPFGFVEKTRFLAEKAISAVISSGIKLMVLAFILSVGEPIIKGFDLPEGLWSFEEIWSILLVSGGIAFLAWNAPNVASGLLSGSPSLSANSAASQAGQAAMVAGTAVSAGVAATGAAASVAGGAVKMASAAKTGADIAGGAAAMGGAGPIGTAAARLKGGAEAVGKGVWNRTGGKVADFMKQHAAEGSKEGYVNTGGKLPKSSKSSEGPAWASAMIQSLQNARQESSRSAKGNGDNL